MLKQANPSQFRRLSGAALLTVLAAGAGYAAWAAAPATAPAVGYLGGALTPQPVAPIALGAAETPKPKSAPAAKSVATPAPAPPQPALPMEVCASNICAEVAAPAPSPPLVTRVPYVGAAPIPAAQAFVKYFDGNSPVKLHGRVSEVRMTDGFSTDVMLQAEDGKLYRVIGGNPANLPPEIRAKAQALVGAEVDVRGYLAHDKTCEGGCIVNGRDVTLPDGTPVLIRPQ